MGGTIRVADSVEVVHVFADRWRKSVDWADYHLNGIMISYLHLDDARLRTSLSEFARLPGFERSSTAIDHALVARARETWRRRCTRDFGSFCAEYQIDWQPRLSECGAALQ
jgi:hypothetical protein